MRYEDYKQGLEEQKKIREYLAENLDSGDVLVFPTVHDAPPLLSASVTKLKEFALKTSRHTCIAALSGFPEISIPLQNIKNNFALGMSFLGRAGEDRSITTFASSVHATLSIQKRTLKIK